MTTALRLLKSYRVPTALVAGRRLFDLIGGWGGRHPLDVPVVVVAHRAPPEWAKEGWPFTFVTDGVESAIERAKAIAGDRGVAVASTTIVQQCLKAGRLEIRLLKSSA